MKNCKPRGIPINITDLPDEKDNWYYETQMKQSLQYCENPDLTFKSNTNYDHYMHGREKVDSQNNLMERIDATPRFHEDSGIKNNKDNELNSLCVSEQSCYRKKTHFENFTKGKEQKAKEMFVILDARQTEINNSDLDVSPKCSILSLAVTNLSNIEAF